MKKQTARRGFTITELVIVIVVIAILAAVLIPTFASLIKKANLSSDQQAVRQMNVILKAESVDKKLDFKGAMEILDEAGFEVSSLDPITKGHTFYWCSEDNMVLLVEDAADKVIYPTDKKIVATYSLHKAAALLTDLKEGSTYINVEAADSETAQNALASGSDLSLKANVALENKVNKVPAGKEMTVDLNGYELDASAVQNRPFEMEDGATLTINAEGSTIKCGLYGLVNIPSGISGNIVINGGTIESDMDNGAFIKLRAGGGDVNITLNNVNFVDKSGDSFIVNSKGYTGNLNIVIKGGSYKAQTGFSINSGNLKIEGATIETNSFAFEIVGNAEITNCTIKSGNAKTGDAPAAAVAVCGGGTATVSKCTINADTVAFCTYSSGGTITANNNTVTAATLAQANALANDATVNVSRITVDGVVKAEATK